MHVARTLVALAVLAALAGCSGDDSTDGDRAGDRGGDRRSARPWPTGSPEPGPGAPLTPGGSPSPSAQPVPPPPARPGKPATIPACVAGRYVVANASSTRTLTTPAGPVRVVASGPLPVELGRNGTWRLSDTGTIPVTLDAAGRRVAARLNGAVAGTFAPAGATYAFRQTNATGTLTGSTGGATVTVAAGAIGPGIVPGGSVRVTCTPTGVTLTAQGTALALRRVR